MIVFDWDQWNRQKNEEKHGVNAAEAESAFADPHLLVYPDMLHSAHEKRFGMLGFSNDNRLLMVGFTRRNGKIRVITARPASRKERKLYDEKKSQKIWH